MRRHGALSVLILSGLLMLSACTSGKPGTAGANLSHRPPRVAVLLRHLGAAMREATSVRISGTVREGGKILGVNLALTRSGHMSGQVSRDRAGFTVLATRGHVYVRPTAAFVKAVRLPSTVCRLVCGKYLELPSARSRALLRGLNMTRLMASLIRIARTAPRAVRYRGTATVAGRPAWLLVSRGYRLFVAARGKPYPLRFTAPVQRDGSVSLTQWNAVRIPGPPPASEVVNLSQLVQLSELLVSYENR